MIGPGSLRRRWSPNHGERRGGARPSILLLHYTGMESGKAAEDWLCDPRSEVSSHYLVHEDGEIVQMVEEDRRAWHAGRASWRGNHDINSCSIGIEIANGGHAFGMPDFGAAQIEALIGLCRAILGRWPIRPEMVLAHSDVAPGRKIDPGEKFPWALLHRAGIGRYVVPAPVGEAIAAAVTPAEIAACQRMLARYGYEIRADGVWDPWTETVLAAFQRHFRPARVDGIADRSTLATLEALIASLEQGED